MSYKKRILGEEIYNPVSKRPSPRGMKQYLQPATNELAGKTLEVWLDGLDPIFLRFLDGTNLEWANPGQCFRWEHYEAIKGDETTFMIKYLLEERSPATCVTLIWDTLSTLITGVIAIVGENPQRPKLVTSKVYFGAEKRGREPLSTERHGYTKELIGKRVIWRYNQSDEVMHIYCGENYFRLGQSEKTLAENASPQEVRHYEYLTGRVNVYPYYEEPAYYIKIKEGMYLYSVTEANINTVLPEEGGGQMLIILNALRPRYVGRSFGLNRHGGMDSQLIGAIGMFCDEPDEVESVPYPIYKFE